MTTYISTSGELVDSTLLTPVAMEYGKYNIDVLGVTGGFTLTATEGNMPVVSAHHVLLKANQTYELNASVEIRADWGNYKWYLQSSVTEATAGDAYIGNEGTSASSNGPDPASPTTANAIITPSKDMYAILVITSLNNWTGTTPHRSMVTIKQIASHAPISTIGRAYGQFKLSAASSASLVTNDNLGNWEIDTAASQANQFGSWTSPTTFQFTETGDFEVDLRLMFSSTAPSSNVRLVYDISGVFQGLPNTWYSKYTTGPDEPYSHETLKRIVSVKKDDILTIKVLSSGTDATVETLNTYLTILKVAGIPALEQLTIDKTGLVDGDFLKYVAASKSLVRGDVYPIKETQTGNNVSLVQFAALPDFIFYADFSTTQFRWRHTLGSTTKVWISWSQHHWDNNTHSTNSRYSANYANNTNYGLWADNTPIFNNAGDQEVAEFRIGDVTNPTHHFKVTCTVGSGYNNNTFQLEKYI